MKFDNIKKFKVHITSNFCERIIEEILVVTKMLNAEYYSADFRRFCGIVLIVYKKVSQKMQDFRVLVLNMKNAE
jgi:hypothetical protein